MNSTAVDSDVSREKVGTEGKRKIEDIREEFIIITSHATIACQQCYSNAKFLYL
jgi:hypothetical protein